MPVAFCHTAGPSAGRAARLVIDRYGRPGGPLVIALHGAVANRKTWLPLSRTLPPGMELWCPDLPGHGSRSDEPFALARAVDGVAGLLHEADKSSRPVVVAGDSLGGYVALLAARAHPGVAGVCAGGCTWTMTGAHGKLARASDLPARLAEAVLGAPRLERFAAALLARIADAETACAIVRDGLRVRARSESLRELTGLDLHAVVRDIEAPIVFVNGALDWPTRAGEAALARVARSARVVLARRTGHGVGFFAPAVFAQALNDLVP